VQLEMQNTDTEDINVIAGWQPHADPEQIKDPL
jgi:hypothetical protein